MQFEGFRSEPYKDLVGITTWGYGHAIKKNDVVPQSITESEATALLCADLVPCETCIDDKVEVPLTQNQFDALCSFIFNLGTGAFSGSTLLKDLNAGDYASAAMQFTRWNKAGGKEVAGLTRRRIAEQQLFTE